VKIVDNNKGSGQDSLVLNVSSQIASQVQKTPGIEAVELKKLCSSYMMTLPVESTMIKDMIWAQAISHATVNRQIILSDDCRYYPANPAPGEIHVFIKNGVC
jgi:hypothetical protein